MTDMQQPNPYAPPAAPVDRAAPPRPAAKKPISAWFVQLLAIAICCGLALGIFRVTAWLVANRGLAWAWADVLVGSGWRALVLAIAVGAVVGTQRRAGYGRWTGLVCVAMVFAVFVYTRFFVKSPSARTFAYSSQAAGEAGELFGSLLIFGLIVWWFYAFGFSAKARTYFQRAPGVDRH